VLQVDGKPQGVVVGVVKVKKEAEDEEDELPLVCLFLIICYLYYFSDPLLYFVIRTHMQPFNGPLSGTKVVGTRRNMHTLTPILIIKHPYSTSSIYCYYFVIQTPRILKLLVMMGLLLPMSADCIVASICVLFCICPKRKYRQSW